MTKAYLMVLAGLLTASSLANADTLNGNTDTISAVLDRESNGQHVVVDGSFTFNTPASGTVVGISNLTAFSISLTSQTNYGWGVEEPIETYTGGLSNLNSFTFNEGNDLVTLSLNVTDQQDSDTQVFTIGPNTAPFLFGNSAEIGAFGNAWGPADPTAVILTESASNAPEPEYAFITGLLLACIGAIRWNSKKRCV